MAREYEEEGEVCSDKMSFAEIGERANLDDNADPM